MQVLALEDTSDIEARVTDALQLRDDLVHRVHPVGAVLTELALSYIAEVFGYLELYPVSNLLVVLEFLEKLVEAVLIVRLVDSLTGVCILPLDYLGEMHHFLLRLLERQLRGTHHSALDVPETEDLLLVPAALDDPGDQLDYLRGKPYQDTGIGDVEQGMDGRYGIKKGG